MSTVKSTDDNQKRKPQLEPGEFGSVSYTRRLENPPLSHPAPGSSNSFCQLQPPGVLGFLFVHVNGTSVTQLALPIPHRRYLRDMGSVAPAGWPSLPSSTPVLTSLSQLQACSALRGAGRLFTYSWTALGSGAALCQSIERKFNL